MLRSFGLTYIIRRRAELIRRFPLFAELPVEDCERIVALAHERCFGRGNTIFLEGDPVQQVVLLTSGTVKLSQFGPDGQEVILRLVGPGEPLCVECVPGCTHSSTARVVEESAALVWEASQFRAVRNRFQAFERNIALVLLQTLNQLEVRYREISTNNVAPRLSSQLLRLVIQLGKKSDGHVELPLSVISPN